MRHTEKWRLALEMIEEMTGPGGWGLLEQVTVAGGARPVAVADAGYGDNALFREELTAAGWQYVVAVKGTTSAHPAEAVPQTAPYAGRGQPPKAAYPHPPVNLRQLAIAAAGQIRPVAWRQGTRTTRGNPEAAMTSHFLAIRGTASRRVRPPPGRSQPPSLLAAGRRPPHAGELTD